MRHEIEWHDGSHDVTVRTFGTATLEGSIAYAAELLEDPRLRPGVRILLDHRGLEAAITSAADIQAMVDFVARNEERFGGGRCAVVVSLPLAYGLTRMWQSLAQGRTSFLAEPFYDLGGALGWLAQGDPGDRP